MTAGYNDPARRDRPDAAARLAELESEVAALRRALARAGLDAAGAAERRAGELAGERAGRAADAASARSEAAEVEARHGREAAAGRADLAAAEDANGALRRANAELAASRAALREREERLRLVLDSAADYAIIGMDLDRRVTTWNAGAERLLGWAGAEIVGRRADEVFTPEDRAAGAPEREAEGALRDGRADNERWHETKDGTRFWGSGLMMPLRDPEAEPAAPPLGLLKVMRDGTERRRAEEALREGEAGWRGLFERMTEGFALCEMVHDAEGRVVDYRFSEVNAAWERHTGIPQAAAVGRLVSEIVTDAEERAFWIGFYARAVGTGEPARVERHSPTIGRWLEVTVYGTGEPGRAATLVTDVSERKAAETRRDALVELGDRLRGLRDPAEIARTAAGGVGRALGALRAGYSRVDIDEGSVRVDDDWTAGPAAASFAGSHRMPDFWPEAVLDALRRGEAVAVGDVALDPRTAPHAARFAASGIGATLHAPVVHGGRLAAVLCVHAAGRREWTEEEAVFVRGAADRIWTAIGRARAEEALRDREALWRGLFERMAEGFGLCEMVYDAGGRAVDYRHLELNAAWGRLTGVPVEAGQGRLASEAIPGLEPFWTETYARVVETGEPARVERFVAPLGRWYEVRAYRAGPGRFAALFTDVSERKAAETRRDALVELGDRLRDLRDPAEIAGTAAAVIGRALGAARAGYGTVDAAEGSVRIERDWTRDPALAGLTGDYRLSDFWTAPLLDGLRGGGVAAIGDVACDPRTAPHAASFAALGVRSCVYAPVAEAGRLAALLYVLDAVPRDWTAEEVAFARNAADRARAAAERARAEAALRESESHRRAALDAARLGTFEWDLATEAVALDGRAREIFGFAPGEGGTAGEVFGRVHPGDLPRVRAAVMAAAAACARVEADYRVVLPNGAVRVVGSVGDFRAGADGRAARMAGVFADITERQRADERRALLVNELNHRVKNTLAVVQSLALQTARGAADVPAFTAAFQARLMALARAHDLLTREDWGGAPLGAVARAALEPSGGGGRVEFSACGGAGVLLPPAQALALAMALHELATNALKHGALSVSGGRVAVACREAAGAADAGHTVEWVERGGPPVPGSPARRGFGLRLLERGLAAQAGMAADLRFEPEGVRCTLRFPPVPIGAPAKGA